MKVSYRPIGCSVDWLVRPSFDWLFRPSLRWLVGPSLLWLVVPSVPPLIGCSFRPSVDWLFSPSLRNALVKMHGIVSRSCSFVRKCFRNNRNDCAWLYESISWSLCPTDHLSAHWPICLLEQLRTHYYPLGFVSNPFPKSMRIAVIDE